MRLGIIILMQFIEKAFCDAAKALFLHIQDNDQLQSKFQVLRVNRHHRNKELSVFLNDCHMDFECEKVFYQFPKAGIELLHYRDIIKVPKHEVSVSCS